MSAEAVERMIIVSNLKLISKAPLGPRLHAEPVFTLQPVFAGSEFGLKIKDYNLRGRLYERNGRLYNISALLQTFGGARTQGAMIRQFDSQVSGLVNGSIKSLQENLSQGISSALEAVPLPSQTASGAYNDPSRLVRVSYDESKRTTWVRLNKSFFPSFGPGVRVRGFRASGNRLDLTFGTVQSVDAMARSGFKVKLDEAALFGSLCSSTRGLQAENGFAIDAVKIGDRANRHSKLVTIQARVTKLGMNADVEIPLLISTSRTNRISVIHASSRT